MPLAAKNVEIGKKRRPGIPRNAALALIRH